MAECPNHNSVVDATVELLAANTTEAIDLMDSYSRNYKNKIQAKMTPAVSESVSSVIDSVHFTLLLAWYNPQKAGLGIAEHLSEYNIFLWTL